MLQSVSIHSESTVWDLCIVGTGPVGMALALEFERLGKTVLVLESGPATEPTANPASDATIVDPDRHASMSLAVCRALGGTSWTWGGRCVAYDAIDWLDRPFVPEAHWPVTEAEVAPFYARAAEYLLCGNAQFEIPYKRPLTAGLTLETVERWARESRIILEHRDHILASNSIRLSVESTVIALNLNAEGSALDSLTVATPAGQHTVRGRHIILAMGGIETTRLLLATQQNWPQHFGGVGGTLGRYYMGHISGKIADIVFNNPAEISDLDFHLDSSGAFHRRRFMLTTAAQLEHAVLNTAFWPDNPPFYDPTHRSGVLSSVFLALAFPPTGRKLVSEGIRLAHTGPRPYPLLAHLRNAILGAPQGALDIYRILRDRFIRKPKKPGFLVSNRGGKYALHYHAEQVPNPESRVTLNDDRDQFGMPRVTIDLRFVQQDIDSVLRSHDLLDKALRENGIGHLEYRYPAEDLPAKVDSQAADGYHQVGTTRMGDDPRTSIVDRDLMVHGIPGLYIASSSVFPASGQANSTLLAVAFAMRLAAKLTKEI